MAHSHPYSFGRLRRPRTMLCHGRLQLAGALVAAQVMVVAARVMVVAAQVMAVAAQVMVAAAQVMVAAPVIILPPIDHY